MRGRRSGGLDWRYTRRGGRAVECTGLENRSPCKRTAGSNPAPSALALAAKVRGGLAAGEGDEVAELDVDVLVVRAPDRAARRCDDRARVARAANVIDPQDVRAARAAAARPV